MKPISCSIKCPIRMTFFFFLLDKDVDSSGVYVATSNSVVLSHKYIDEYTFFVIGDINFRVHLDTANFVEN